MFLKFSIYKKTGKKYNFNWKAIQSYVRPKKRKEKKNKQNKSPENFIERLF